MGGQEKRLLKEALRRLHANDVSRDVKGASKDGKPKQLTQSKAGTRYVLLGHGETHFCLTTGCLQIVRCAAKLAKHGGITKTRKKARRHLEKHPKTESYVFWPCMLLQIHVSANT